MNEVNLCDLDQALLGRRIEIAEDAFRQERVQLSGRGFLLVSDDEQVRDAAIRFLRKRIHLVYLDYNAEAQGKKITEMCLKAFGSSYFDQKNYNHDLKEISKHEKRKDSLILDNFQDIGLLAVRDAKLALAVLRSLGRPPYDKTVIAVGSKDSLDLIKKDTQLQSAWTMYEVVSSEDH